MHRALAGFSLLFSVGLLVAQQDASDPGKAPAEAVSRFSPAPTVISGADDDTHAVAVSANGERIASCGYPTAQSRFRAKKMQDLAQPEKPASGFVSVVDARSKKQLLLLRSPRQIVSAAISPDGKLVAFTDGAWGMKVVEIDTGKTIYTKLTEGRTDLAFALDGRSFATVSGRKTIQVWDLASGNEIGRVSAETQLYRIGLSPDGKKVAATIPDGISIWDVATSQLLSQLKIDAVRPFQALDFSPDGTLLATETGARERNVQLWDVATGALKTQWASKNVAFTGFVFTPDGQKIAAGVGDGGIRIWNANSGAEIGVLGPGSGQWRCLAFLDSGKKLVSGGKGQAVKFWDVTGKKELATLGLVERPQDLPLPTAMAVTSDGSLAALATEDRGVILRDGRTGEAKGALTGHDDAINCLAFSPDGKTLATGSSDKTIKLWDVAARTERATLSGHRSWVYALAFSPDGKTLASGGYDKTVRLWDAENGKQKGTIPAHSGAVRAVAFSPDGKTLASGGSDRLVKMWGVPGLELKFTLKKHEETVRTLAFSPHGSALASGGEDGLVELWNASSGKELVSTKKEHTDPVTTVAFADDRLLLSGSAAGPIRQWDVAAGEVFGDLPGHKGGVVGVAVAGRGKQLFSAGADRMLKRLRRDLPGPVRLFVGHTGDVTSVCFSPDGQRVVSCGSWPESDRTIRVWDFKKGMEILRFEHPGAPDTAHYSPDGKFIATASDDANAYLWDAATGKLIRTFKGHGGGVNRAEFNSDGTRLLTCSLDKTARVWETATGREIQKFTCPDMIQRSLFHPDGKHALSGARDGIVRMWDIETGKEVKQFQSPDQESAILALSRDGKYLATGRRPFCAFEIESGQKFPDCIGHQNSGETNNEFNDDGMRLYQGGFPGAVNITFSPDGKRILSGGFDNTVRLWDAKTGKELYRFQDHREFVCSVAFSPDGRWILTGGGGQGTVDRATKGSDLAIRLWKMPDEKAIEEYLTGD